MFSFQEIESLKTVFLVVSGFPLLAARALVIMAINLSVSHMVAFGTEDLMTAEPLGNVVYVSKEFEHSQLVESFN